MSTHICFRTLIDFFSCTYCRQYSEIKNVCLLEQFHYGWSLLGLGQWLSFSLRLLIRLIIVQNITNMYFTCNLCVRTSNHENWLVGSWSVPEGNFLLWYIVKVVLLCQDFRSLGMVVEEQEEENKSLSFDFLTCPDFCLYCLYLDIFDSLN